jgi:radical SAM superfamily enzyme YgiQ (UPF0313 family)
MDGSVLFVYPSSYGDDGAVIKCRLGAIPSRTLPYLAGLTPPSFNVILVDESVDQIDFGADVSAVAFTGLVHNMPRAVDIAREFKNRNKPTIIGGIGAYSVSDAISQSGAFSCIVSGEAEELWPTVLNDLAKGRLQDRYECSSLPSLDGMPRARFELLRLDRYMRSPVDRKLPMIPVETSRGCPHNCSFCSVSRYFGKRMRYHPVGEVLEEIKQYGAKHIVFTDDNIAINPDRAKELFLALKPLGIQWFGQFESRIVLRPDIVRIAAESGCRSAFVGIESLNSANLKSINKLHNEGVDLRDLARVLGGNRIILLGSIVFGLDEDTPESIESTVERMITAGWTR